MTSVGTAIRLSSVYGGAAEDIGEVRLPDIVQMGRLASIAAVEPDDEMTAPGESVAELVWPGDHLHGEPHDQHNRRLTRVTERLVGEFDVTRWPAGPACWRRRHSWALSCPRARPGPCPAGSGACR